MMNAYSPANFRPDGTLGGADDITWGDVLDTLGDKAKEKVTDLGIKIITDVQVPGTGAGNSTPGVGAPTGTVTIIRERAAGFGQWIADNPIPAAGIAGLALYLLIRRR